MFTALTNNGQTISLLTTPRECFPSHYPPPYYCPACSQNVILKKGTKRRWHFAHQSGSLCAYQSEPETEEHLAGKLVLYQWLKEKGLSPSVEAFISSIRRTADVLFTWKNNSYALEFQCSSISSEETIQRTKDYYSVGITPIWIFSLSRLRKMEGPRYVIHSFEWIGLRERRKDLRHAFIYFSPESSSFYYLFPRALPANSAVFGDVYTMPIIHTPIEHLIYLPNTLNGPLTWSANWMNQKKNWRFHTNQWRGKPDKTYMRQIFAKHRSDLPFFPSEAGWPSLSMEAFQTSSYIWQSWILLCFLPNIPLYQRFSSRTICHEIHSLILNDNFIIRELPSISSPIEKAVFFYLELLQRIGILKNTGAGWKKVKNIFLPISLEDAFKMDKKWSNIIFYKGIVN
ncbi:competence protein CoiA [Alteribacillus sp. YIM 98480]|uniref:competence protein CoiA n=1 Tax=Alteribacillus sp. YIM 98480 TaxID=2606599 RepID=UPI00131E5ABE|nr:competence protein CoiA family protein [Alteribacillus sp. YIM 98480]